MVQDEPKENDRFYEIDGFFFIMDREEERNVSCLEIDFEKGWWGQDFIVTAGF